MKNKTNIEEARKDSMERIKQEDIQPMLLEVLRAFDRYCTENNYRYFLTSGTLIGAIRHHGFIPWDDDIDVNMLYDDYDRLLDQAREDPFIDPSKRFRIMLPATGANFYPFMKVVDTKTIVYEKDIDHKYATGMWVDIFRFSKCPEDRKEINRIFRKRNIYQNMNKILVCGNLQTPSYKRIYPLVRIGKACLCGAGLTPQAIGGKIFELQFPPGASENLLCNIAWDTSREHVFKSEWFEETVQVDFEGFKFPAPACYDEVLTKLFGDYMQLPPEDQRIRHDFEAYKLD